MDVATLANVVLVASAVVFVSAVAYRVRSAVARRPRGGKPLSRAEEAELEQRSDTTYRAGGSEKISPQISAKEIIESTLEGRETELAESAGGLVDYAVARGATLHVRPEVLSRMARQFAVLLDLDQGGGLPGDPQLRRDVFREVFMRMAVQARK